MAGSPRGLVGRGREGIDRPPGGVLGRTAVADGASASGARTVLTRRAHSRASPVRTRGLWLRAEHSQDVLTEMALPEGDAHVAAAHGISA